MGRRHKFSNTKTFSSEEWVPEDEDRDGKKKKSPIENAGILSNMFYMWLVPLFNRGRKQEIASSDIHDLHRDLTCQVLGNRLERAWINEMLQTMDGGRKMPRLVVAIWKSFGPSLLILTAARIVIEGCLIGQALLVERLVADPSSTSGLHFGLGTCGLSVVYVILHQGWTTMAFTVGLQLRVACSCLLYRKVLRMDLVALHDPQVDHLLSSVTQRVAQFDELTVYLPHVICGPVSAVIVCCILWDHLGATCLVGVASMALLIPLQVFAGRKIGDLVRKASKKTEERLRTLKEVAAGIVQIKQFVWEDLFESKCRKTRSKEAHTLRKATLLHAVICAAHSHGTKLMTLFTITTFVLTGNTFTTSNAFLTLCAIHALRLPLCLYMPLGISLSNTMSSTVNDIQTLLLLGECTNKELRLNRVGPIYSRIILMDACAKWAGHVTRQTCTLAQLHLGVKPGEVLAVVGLSGAGKSSLLHLLLGELPACSGKVQINGRVSYCPQKSWAFPGTLRRNITCHGTYNEARFMQVIEVCDLSEAMRAWPGGENVRLGHNGDVTLSPTELAKVTLARAVYQEADIYLLDQPLAALDRSNANTVFNRCVEGFLRNKCVVMATAAPRFVKHAGQILVLHEGRMEGCGSYNDLTEQGIEFHKYIAFDLHEEIEEEVEDKRTGESKKDDDRGHKEPLHIPREVLEIEARASQSVPDVRYEGTHEASSAVHKRDSEAHEVILDASALDASPQRRSKRTLSMLSTCSPTNSRCDLVDTDRVTSQNALNAAKKRTITKVVAKYLRAGSSKKHLVTIAMMFALYQWAMCSWDYCFLIWAANEENQTHTNWFPRHSRDDHVYLSSLWIIVSLSLATSLCASLCVLWVYAAANTWLHNKLLAAMLHVPLKLMDKDSLDTILSIFTQDMKVIDEVLPATLLETTQYIMMIFGCLVVISVVNVTLIIPIVVLVTLVCVISYLCVPSTSALKMVEAAKLRVVEEHLKTTLEGLTSIRALDAEQLFTQEFSMTTDKHSACTYLLQSATHALGLWLGLVSVLVTLATTLCFVLLEKEVKEEYLGIAIYCSLVLTTLVPEAVTSCANAAKYLTSAGRIIKHSKCSKNTREASSLKTISCIVSATHIAGPPLSNWPQKGQIRVSRLSLRFVEQGPFALQNLNFTVKPGEKVGIVGCLGAGKSALIVALLRLMEPPIESTVYIDDVDTRSINVKQLRKRISVVPRYPTIFSGTLRDNLDPEKIFPDNILWDALEQVELRSVVQGLHSGLQTESLDWSKVLTTHQRQLFYLARAAIADNKILIVDMATGNLDPLRELSMLQTIKAKFNKCTVLIVSQRLRSVMKTDRVLVLEQGKMAEFGHPYLLLQNQNSHLYKMVRQTGVHVKQQLFTLAREAYLIGSKQQQQQQQLEESC